MQLKIYYYSSLFIITLGKNVKLLSIYNYTRITLQLIKVHETVQFRIQRDTMYANTR